MSSGKPFDCRWWGAFGHQAFGHLAAKVYDVISSRASPPAHLAFLTIIHDPPALLDARRERWGLSFGSWILDLEQIQPLTITENENNFVS